MIVTVGVTSLSLEAPPPVKQSQKAVTAYLKSKQLLPFGFAVRPACQPPCQRRLDLRSEMQGFH